MLDMMDHLRNLPMFLYKHRLLLVVVVVAAVLLLAAYKSQSAMERQWQEFCTLKNAGVCGPSCRRFVAGTSRQPYSMITTIRQDMPAGQEQPAPVAPVAESFQAAIRPDVITTDAANEPIEIAVIDVNRAVPAGPQEPEEPGEIVVQTPDQAASAGVDVHGARASEDDLGVPFLQSFPEGGYMQKLQSVDFMDKTWTPPRTYDERFDAILGKGAASP